MKRRLRSAAKRAVEGFLVGVGAPAISRAVRSGCDIVLAYHNVIPDGCDPGGDIPLHLHREDFASQLDLLVRTHRVIPLQALLDPERREVDGGPVAVLTFDDGYRGALTLGLEELRARELPATFFVAPGLLGQAGLWWDELGRGRDGGLRSSFRRDALQLACGKAEDVYALAESRGWDRRRQPEYAGVVTMEELRRAAGQPGVTLGSHSWSHVNLACVGDEELTEQLERPLEWLGEHFADVSVPWLSLPFGLARPGLEERARELGYGGVLRLLGGGMLKKGTDPYAVPRVSIPAGLSADGYRLRLAGL